MKRLHFIAASAAIVAAAPRAAFADDEGYDLVTPTGTIYGSLAPAPRLSKPPVVLIVAGSGPTDRNGNNPLGVKTDAYRLLARALGERGIASVRYDKRGIAASAAAGAAESGLRFDDYVADATAWVSRIRADGRFGKIAIAGHSEGSLIGMIAAKRAAVDAFISLDGAGYPAPQVLRAQLGPKLAAAPELAAANERILTALTAGQTVGDVPPELMALYRPSVQPYLISWFHYDPRIEIAKLACSVAIVQGTADIQVTVDDAKTLAAALPRAQLVLVDGMSHVLKKASDTSAEGQMKTVYADPSLPLDPAVPAAIANALA